MVERREFITICRQISSMMEAGVDIRRITRVLRAQTDNPRLLSLYDELDHDLRMGKSLVDAMERAPDVFSPFAVSLVRAGEERNDLAGAFHQIADFLQKEEEARAHDRNLSPSDEGTIDATEGPYPIAPLLTVNATVNALDSLIDRLQVAALSTLTIAAGLLLTLAAVWWSVEVGLMERRWLSVTLCSVAALFIGGAGVWVRRRLDAEQQKEPRCSFCGQTSSESGAPLQRAPRFAATAICMRCAAIFAQQKPDAPHNGQPTPLPTTPVAGTEAADASAKPPARPVEPQQTANEPYRLETTGPGGRNTTASPQKSTSVQSKPANLQNPAGNNSRNGRSTPPGTALPGEADYE